MAQFTVILREDRASGRLSVAAGAKGEKSWSDHKKAEMEQSRLAMRDEAGACCVYAGIFKDLDAAVRFCQFRNQGVPIEKAMRLLQQQRP